MELIRGCRTPSMNTLNGRMYKTRILKLLKVDHPNDLTSKEKPFLIVDQNGSEVISNG